MARDLTTNFVTAIESDVVRPFFAAKFEFATVTVRAWTGYGNITVNSEVYKGVGTFGQINTVAETKVPSIEVTLDVSQFPISWLNWLAPEKVLERY